MVTDQVDTCQEPDSDDPSKMCGAAPAAEQRCLAHLTPAARTTYLATLAPGADIDAGGVTFTQELLTELLNAFHDPHGHPQLGTALFVGAIFSGDADFRGATFAGDADFSHHVTFSVAARFNDVTFSGNALFGGATFTGDAWFDGATFSGVTEFSHVTFHLNSRFYNAVLAGDTEFRAATFAHAPTRVRDPVGERGPYTKIYNTHWHRVFDRWSPVLGSKWLILLSIRDGDARRSWCRDGKASGWWRVRRRHIDAVWPCGLRLLRRRRTRRCWGWLAW